MKKTSNGLSLVEVLLVAAIVALMGGLLLPVLVKARAQGKRAVCVSQLRQLGVAMHLYMADFDGKPFSRGWEWLAQGAYVSDERLLMCPSDPFDGFASKHEECLGRELQKASSYYSPFAPTPSLWELISKHDANPGILACRVHGDRSNRATLGPEFCRTYAFSYEGVLLRLRLDGSVQHAKLSLRPSGPNETATLRYWELFTDVPGSVLFDGREP